MPEGWCQLHIWGYWYFSWKTLVVSNYVRPTDSSPPGSPVPGILQARTLEWVAISFSNAWKWKVKVKSLSHVWFLATPWTAAHQAPPCMGFSRQEYWSGLPLPSPMLLLPNINWALNMCKVLCNWENWSLKMLENWPKILGWIQIRCVWLQTPSP